MTFLCGLGGLELEAVEGSKRGDVSVEAEAMADNEVGILSLTAARCDLIYTLETVLLLLESFGRYRWCVASWRKGERANGQIGE